LAEDHLYNAARCITPLGHYLVGKKPDSKDALSAALAIQSDLANQGTYLPLGEIMVENRWIDREGLDQCLRQQRADAIGLIELFNTVPPETLDLLSHNSRNVIQQSNSTIFEQSDPGDCYYIIISGKVLVLKRSDTAEEVPLATLGPGEGFGEMALLTGQPRAATVRALERTSLISISKELFDRAVNSSPSVAQAFVRVLAERLSKGNTQVVQTYRNERAYRQFIAEQTEKREPKVAGSSRAVVELLSKVDAISGNRGPVLITGEPGTEVWDVAGLLHKPRKAPDNGLLSMDAKTVGVTAGGPNPGGREAFPRELAQLSTLFGRNRDFLPFAKEGRLGLLQLVGNGTVLIENVEFLSPGVQAALKDFLKSGSFRILGESHPVTSAARIIAATHADLAATVSTGGFDKELYDLLSAQMIPIPPLRKRKKDIKEIIVHLLERNCSETGKAVAGIDEDAYKAVMAYDWPGNVEELNDVIRRAAILARGDLLALEDIFIGPPPVTGAVSYNLFQLPKIRDFMRSRVIPAAFQLAAGPLIALIIAVGLLGSQSPERNIALVMVWGLWEPLVVISSFFGARLWCKVCPIGALSELLAKTAGLKKQIPLFLRKYGYYLSAAGLATIFWSESASGMTSSPSATALLMLTIVLLASATGMLFQRRAWCRYICPLGGMVGVLSTCSAVELRSNYNICTNTCTKHECYMGSASAAGCPLFEGPFSLRSNQNCILCGKCVEICPNNSPVLNLRPPGQELWTSRKTEKNTVALGLVLIGTQVFRGLEHAGFFHPFEAMGAEWWLYSCALLAGIIALVFLFVASAARRVFPVLNDEEGSNAHLLVYTLIPLAVGYEVGFHMERMLTLGPQFLLILGRQVGLGIDLPGAPASAVTVRFLQVCLILLGMSGSLMVLRKLLRRHTLMHDTSPPGGTHRMPVLIAGASYLLLLLLR
jgi:DNA-binding NtrC family response regulator/polyferredoxin